MAGLIRHGWFMADNKNSSVLIVDDIQSARASLQITMSNLGFGKIRCVSGVKEAMEVITSNDFNVILCDYYMGDKADGQQFLEFLRAKHVIRSSTIFIMVTAEQSYTHVITAAECAPDDYLVKPFTGAAIMVRLERLFERNEALGEVFRLFDAQNYDGAISACNEAISAKSKFVMDAMRIKGESLLLSERYQEAIEHYQKIVLARDLPWAKLGLAKAYLGNQQMDKAEAITRSVIRDNPKYLAAYDFLSRLLKQLGKKKEALAALQHAAEISVRSVTRQRHIGEMALESGDLKVSEAAMKSVIARNKNSPMKEASDYAMLSNVMIEMGAPDQALAVIKEAREDVKGVPAMDKAVLASIEAVAYRRAGNEVAAQQSLAEAMANISSDEGLPEGLSMALARACIENGEVERGMRLMRNVIQMNPEDREKQERIKNSLLASGVDENKVNQLIDSSLDEVKEINNQGVLLAREGKYEEAYQLMQEALERVPTNQQYLSNAAAILLADLERNKLDHIKLDKAKNLVLQLKQLNPGHQKLSGLNNALERISQKIGSLY
jgi:DNA-binding response OmpR family regulator/Tfp pilus assembly protein PilF